MADLADWAALQLLLSSFPVLLLAVVGWRLSAKLRELVRAPAFAKLAVAVAVVVILLFAGRVALYLVYPGYVDPVQTTVASMSYMAEHGRAVYAMPGSGSLYGKPFGPLLYLLDGLGLWLSPSILGSKLPGVIACAGAIAGMAGILRRCLADRRAAFLALAVFILLLVPYGTIACWNRAEPFLLLLATASLGVLGLGGLWAELALGLLLGGAVSLKIHGFLYIVPAAFALIGRRQSWRARAGSVLVMGAAALLVALSPFALPQVSLRGYAFYLSLAVGVGIDWSLLWVGIVMLGGVAGPPALLYALLRPSLSASQRWFLAAFIVSAACLVLVSGRLGAGPYHLIPLVPASLYATAFLARSGLTDRQRLSPSGFWAAGVFLALVVGFPGFLYSMGGPSVAALLRGRAAMGEAMAELDGFAGQYPGLQMAVGDIRSFEFLGMQSAPLVMRSGRLTVDFGSWMDLVYSGVDRDSLLPILDGCGVTAWLLPKDDRPFTLISLYDGKPLFTDAFRRRFAANYAPAAAGRFFRVWTCRQ